MDERDSVSQFLRAEQALTPLETEEAYRAAYDSVPLPPVTPGIPATGKRVGFVLHAASLLAHVQLMRGVVRPEDRVFVLAGDAEGFRGMMPCPVICLPPLDLPQRFEALRERLREQQCGTMIWVSVPLYARYAFALRLAKRQVFWAMRYHAVAPGDLNITAGNRGEKWRMFHVDKWRCVHAPFNIETKPVNKLHAEQYRAPYGYCYGSLAREQKYSLQFLECVAQILENHPDSGFVWTGRKEPPAIRQFFRERGLSNRHRFVGWQDPDTFVNTLDCFLETFPLGGLTTFTAMAHGIPVVSLKNEHSPIGSLDAHQGLLAATGSDEYVQMALSLQDRAKRAQAVEAGHKLVQTEQRQAEVDRRRFWETVLG